MTSNFPNSVLIADKALALWLHEAWITPVFMKLIQTYKVAVPKELATHTEFMAHPVSLGKHMYESHISNRIEEFLISEKQDGVRYWLCFGHDHQYEKIAFMMNRNGQKWIVPVQGPDVLYRGTLLDGEWMEHPAEYDPSTGSIVTRFTYVVFDILCYGGLKNIQYCPFEDRLLTVHKIIKHCFWTDQVEFKTKAWMTLSNYARSNGIFDIHDSINSEMALMNPHDSIMTNLCSTSMKSDGHIVMNRLNFACQLATAPPFIFKLKEQHTVDLWLTCVRSTIENNTETWLLELHDDKSIKQLDDMNLYLTKYRDKMEAPYDWMSMKNINIMIRPWVNKRYDGNYSKIHYMTLNTSDEACQSIIELFIKDKTSKHLVEFHIKHVSKSRNNVNHIVANMEMMHLRTDKNRANHSDIVTRTLDHMLEDDRLSIHDLIQNVKSELSFW